MKYFKVLFCLILLISVGITGCSSKEEVTSISTVDVKKLKEHGGTYVGDNSNAVAIIRALPGGETFKEIDLHNKAPKIIYGDCTLFVRQESKHLLNNHLPVLYW
ncbi:DUF4825 domain-containing protein [Priestia aryabhattai]|uniref:DUF4825 domain-containing protein n=1 Tax=Priestia aryabhattai TaxID=412384 RepID=UPI0039A08549